MQIKSKWYANLLTNENIRTWVCTCIFLINVAQDTEGNLLYRSLNIHDIVGVCEGEKIPLSILKCFSENVTYGESENHSLTRIPFFDMRENNILLIIRRILNPRRNRYTLTISLTCPKIYLLINTCLPTPPSSSLAVRNGPS